MKQIINLLLAVGVLLLGIAITFYAQASVVNSNYAGLFWVLAPCMALLVVLMVFYWRRVQNLSRWVAMAVLAISAVSFLELSWRVFRWV